jgi:4'-phosphopantetheinyl transferase
MVALRDVHIWTARVDAAALSVLAPTLSPQEQAAAQRFRFEKHRTVYIFAQGVLRDILGRFTGRSPSELRFQTQSYGKPFLVEGTPAFNLSHSGNVVMVAVADEGHIGVDVEQVRPLPDFQGIAESHFTARERRFIVSQPPEDRERAFFRCWTRKEAYIKAVGKGLSIPLHTFDTFISLEEPGLALPATSDAPTVDSWWLADIDAPHGYLAAVTADSRIDRIFQSAW